MVEVALDVVQGVRPTKPENAPAIGFSDSLWSFVQRCWDSEMKLRPKIAEVVSQLGRAAADWSKVLESPTQCTGSPSAEVGEVAFSRSESASGVRDVVAKDDHLGRWRVRLYLLDRILISPLLEESPELMSNGSPPRACLADFGFTTMVLDPDQPMSCSMQLEGGTMMFMSPEFLEPSKFGITEPIPTPEIDIFAFGLVIYQVCDHDRGHPPLTYIFQVLTGGLPFPGLGMAEITFNAVRLWGEVMPACAQVDCVVPAPPDPVLDSMAHGKLWILTLLGFFPLNNGAGGMGAILESLTVSQAFPTSSYPPSAAFTECTEPPLAEALEDDINSLSEPERTSGNTPPQPDHLLSHHPSKFHASLCFV